MTEIAKMISEKYNKLHEVFAADFYLNRNNKTIAIDRLLEIVREHGLESSVGIRLLHKHNDINLGEVMAEHYRIDQDGFALITRVVPISKISNNYVPNSWTLSDDKFIPLEFSQEQLVNDPAINPINNKEFFLDLAKTIRHLGLGDVLGPSLLGSALIEENRPNNSSMLIESTAQDDRANVLRFIEISNDIAGSSVETHWCVSGIEKDGNEQKPLVTCTKICPSVQNPPVHQGTFIHQQK